MDYLSLCLICKDENDYLPEWLDYHILMGVDRFYIYDNESQVSLRETLESYIERGWAVVVDIQGRSKQLHAYDHCLQTFGAQTQWMGFIDTDEFLVTKNSVGLKSLLKDYEAYGGLVISSIFFGSNGHQQRPVAGQIASYLTHTHPTFEGNALIKTILQPEKVVCPNTPHDFVYKEPFWGVNENFLRVDHQSFPNSVEKIQLNHYYCRSEQEIDLKLKRGRGDAGNPWPKKRFDVVNRLSTIEDKTILTNIAACVRSAGRDDAGVIETPEKIGLPGLLSDLAKKMHTQPIEITPPQSASFRDEMIAFMETKNQMNLAKEQGNLAEVKRLALSILQDMPNNVGMCVYLANNDLDMKDPASAWKMLSYAWQIDPNNYFVLSCMAYLFLRTGNYAMALNTCHLLLDMAPHNLTAMGFLTESLAGLGRFEEALKVGVPVIELSGMLGELPEGMSVYLVKQLSDYLLQKKDYRLAAHLWKIQVQGQPEDVDVILQLANVLAHSGEKIEARKWLLRAQEINPNHEDVKLFLKKIG